MNPLVFAPNRHALLIECLQRSARPIAQSEHFAVYQLDTPLDQHSEPEIVIVHTFARADIDNNIGYYVANELLPLLQSTRQADFEHLVGAIVRSSDIDEQRAWWLFYHNSLAALERAIARPQSIPDFIWPFGSIYNRVLRLVCGQSLLDVGTCFGFLPLIYARQQMHQQSMSEHAHEAIEHQQQIVGFDLDTALVRFANSYVNHSALPQVEFVAGDILADDVVRLGTFDTVTCIHMIEHLAIDQTMPALVNLWQLTHRRLIVGVPIEATPDPRFGHQQVFDLARLNALGQKLGGSYCTFEHHGGWLVVDR